MQSSRPLLPALGSSHHLPFCLLLLGLFGSFASATPPLTFPAHWGSPPTRQADNYIRLPYGYGYGSSTLANWIEVNAKLNRFPKTWGNPPTNVAADYVQLPDNYGFGSSTLRAWILSKIENEKLGPAVPQTALIRAWKPYHSTVSPSPSPRPVRRPPPIKVYAR